MKLKNRRGLSLILLLMWMAFIFYMSARTADQSMQQTDSVIKIFEFLGIEISQRFGEIATTIVRKSAHFVEYMILCLLFFNVFKDTFKNNKAMIISVVCTFIYACTDEFHQIFVPGRAGRFTDVLIDTSGAIFAILIIWSIRFIRKKLKKNKKEIISI